MERTEAPEAPAPDESPAPASPEEEQMRIEAPPPDAPDASAQAQAQLGELQTEMASQQEKAAQETSQLQRRAEEASSELERVRRALESAEAEQHKSSSAVERLRQEMQLTENQAAAQIRQLQEQNAGYQRGAQQSSQTLKSLAAAQKNERQVIVNLQEQLAKAAETMQIMQQQNAGFQQTIATQTNQSNQVQSQIATRMLQNRQQIMEEAQASLARVQGESERQVAQTRQLVAQKAQEENARMRQQFQEEWRKRDSALQAKFQQKAQALSLRLEQQYKQKRIEAVPASPPPPLPDAPEASEEMHRRHRPPPDASAPEADASQPDKGYALHPELDPVEQAKKAYAKAGFHMEDPPPEGTVAIRPSPAFDWSQIKSQRSVVTATPNVSASDREFIHSLGEAAATGGVDINKAAAARGVSQETVNLINSANKGINEAKDAYANLMTTGNASAAMRVLQSAADDARLALYEVRKRMQQKSSDPFVQQANTREAAHAVTMLKNIDRRMVETSGRATEWDLSAAEAQQLREMRQKPGLPEIERFPEGTKAAVAAETHRYPKTDRKLLQYATTPWWALDKLKRDQLSQIRASDSGPLVKKLFERNYQLTRWLPKNISRAYNILETPDKAVAKAQRDQFGSTSDKDLNLLEGYYQSMVSNVSDLDKDTPQIAAAQNLLGLVKKVKHARKAGTLAPSRVTQRQIEHKDDPRPKKKARGPATELTKGMGLPKKPRKRAKRKKKTVKAAEETPIPEETEKKESRPLLKKYYPRSKSASKMCL